MSIGKGSLSRVAVNAKNETKELFSSPDYSVVELGVDSFNLKKKAVDKTLVASLKKYGQILPIVVAADENGALKIADGEKRVLALKEMGANTVKAVVVKAGAEEIKKELSEKSEKKKSEKTSVKDEIAATANVAREELPFYLL